ncbi:MAG TPA: hypothetical protein VJT82_03995, partial [Pyrinomonadaceae bacterium]|nr:hypothetical protein [Pyrinomonadaceae bacterium]
MNCQQFTSHIVELARGQLMDAAARDDAARHADVCAACSSRLAQERGLTTALRAVASNMSDRSAPAHVEAKLLAAFRENLKSANAASAQTSITPATMTASHAPLQSTAPLHVAPATANGTSGGWTRRVAFAALAASLLLVAFVALNARFGRTQSTSDVASNGTPSSVGQPSPVKASQSLPASAPTSSVEVSAAASRDQKRTGESNSSQRAASKPSRINAPKMIVAEQVIDGGSAIIEPVEAQAATNNAGVAAKPHEAESMTDFMPLVAVAPATPMEGGQLVRVQLPRSALASLGLPVNAERGNEPVKADVLLGNDGL